MPHLSQNDIDSYCSFVKSYETARKVRSELIGYQNSVCDENPDLKRVYIVGDSISISYTPVVRNQLTGKVNVVRPPFNCKSSRSLLKELPKILSIGKIDLCLLNCGIHDVLSDRFVPIHEYRSNLKEIVRTVQDRCPCFWVTTTRFYGPDSLRPLAKPAHHKQYCDVSKREMKKMKVPVIDLHPLINRFDIGRGVEEDGMHFTPAGYAEIGKVIAGRVRQFLFPEVPLL